MSLEVTVGNNQPNSSRLGPRQGEQNVLGIAVGSIELVRVMCYLYNVSSPTQQHRKEEHEGSGQGQQYRGQSIPSAGLGVSSLQLKFSGHCQRMQQALQ